MKCRFCDKENPGGTAFCGHCGAALPPSPADAPSQPALPAAAADDVQQQILDQLRAGRKIEAIKIYRAAYHCDLVTAKNAVESLATQHQIVVKATGCGATAGALLLVIGVAAAAWFLIA